MRGNRCGVEENPWYSRESHRELSRKELFLGEFWFRTGFKTEEGASTEGFSASERPSALPTFEWAKEYVPMSIMAQKNPEESGLIRALDRIKFEASAVKEDGRLQMLPIAEPIGVFLIV
jgi:hypothetical protein